VLVLALNFAENDKVADPGTENCDAHKGALVRMSVTPVSGPPSVVDYVVDTSGGLSHVVAEVTGGAVGVVYVRAGDMLLEEIRGGVPKYFEAEGIGSVRSLLDAGGARTDTWTYSAFGEGLGQTGTSAQPYQFAGERNVALAGLYQNRARWLSTSKGAFLSSDPLRGFDAYPLTQLPYSYGGLMPTTASDPTGQSYTVAGLGVAIVIGAAINIAIQRPTTRGEYFSAALVGATAGAALYTGFAAAEALVLRIVAGTASATAAASAASLPPLVYGPSAGGKLAELANGMGHREIC
jgi:RHS repeat-associated protein